MSTTPQPKTISFSARRAFRAVSGFSLVETVISLGIVSFAMLGIFGMIPVGLSNFQTALQLTVESSIVQNVSSSLQRTDWTKFQNGDVSTNLYFDEQGRFVTNAADVSAIYTVKVLPARDLDTSSLVSQDAGKSVQVTVQNRTHPAITNSYSVIIARGQ